MHVSASSAPPAVASSVVAARPSLRARWAEELAMPANRRSWLLLLVLLFGGLVPLVPGFFQHIQQRSGGLLLPDPLLRLLPHHDVGTLIFVLMYGAVVVGVGWLLVHPRLFLRGLWALLLLLLMRMLTIWLVPLVPPLDILPLSDPLLARLFHTSPSEAITKDLFFSGHTSTVALLALAARGWWRRGLAVLMVLVGVLVLVQRVHYTYDVLAAPLFAWLAYWVAAFLTRRATNGPA
ncbi:hypothetical protein A0257_15695 [Hymenobacter psoromatis]|nr:hypothetical protein A0257_15695 [Hymenobacter psoromatis]